MDFVELHNAKLRFDKGGATMAYHFNTRIEIVELRKDPNTFLPEAGATKKVTIAKPWADIKTMKGHEYEQWKQTASEEPIRFIIRYRKGINTKQIVKYDNKEYTITSVTNDDGRNQTLTIFATRKSL